MSMVFKIMASSATFHAVDYNDKKLGKGGAELVHLENFGHLQLGNNTISKVEIKKYLEDYSKRNRRVQSAQFHAMLSCKGTEMTHEQLRDSALEIMGKMGYGENPMLIYSHSDTANNHVHIVTSRIGQNGKKIRDSFEKKRSNTILNDILKLDPKQSFKVDMETAMGYNFSSVPQFLMLLEGKGYSVKEKENEIVFFKHGALQGTTERKILEEKIIANSERSKKTNQIRAIINKYAREYPSELNKNTNKSYSTEKPKFESNLTSYLKENFGYEFVFFAGKDKEVPYGYAMVDHSYRSIYKGSELIKLDELLSIMATKHEKAISGNTTPDRTTVVETVFPTLDSSVPENGATSGIVLNVLALLETNGTAIDSSGGQTHARKKKRRGNFY